MGTFKQLRIVNGRLWVPTIAVLPLGAIAQLAALIVVRELSLEPPRWFFAIQAFPLPFCILGLILTFRHRRRTIAIIRANDGRVCTSCGYPIDAQLDHSPCPECGAAIDLAHCRKVWFKTLGGW